VVYEQCVWSAGGLVDLKCVCMM